MTRARLALAVCAAVLAPVPAALATGTDTVTPITEGLINKTRTGVHIDGRPATTYTVTWTDATGTHTDFVTTNAIGNANFTKSGASVVTVTGGKLPAAGVTADLDPAFVPPDRHPVTTFAVLGGSSINAGGQSFSLGGSFVSEGLSVDYIPGSGTYADYHGSVLASGLGLNGTGPAGLVTLGLGADAGYVINYAAAWAAADPSTVAVPFSFSIAGTLTFNGTPSPFTGTVSGTVTSNLDGSESISASFSLQTSLFGPADGSLVARGTTILVPAPGAAALLAAAGVLAGRRRRVTPAPRAPR